MTGRQSQPNRKQQMNITAQLSALTLIDLLFSAPDASVPAVQDAMRRVAAGEWSEAARSLQYAADFYDAGNAWADDAEKVASNLRAKA